MSKTAKELKAELASVKKQIREIAPNSDFCHQCFSTDVFWMSMPYQSTDGRWRNKPMLFDTGERGGRHVCPITDDFEVVK